MRAAYLLVLLFVAATALSAADAAYGPSQTTKIAEGVSCLNAVQT